MFRTYVSWWRKRRRGPQILELVVDPASGTDSYASVDARLTGDRFEPLPSDGTYTVLGADGIVLSYRGDANGVTLYLARDGDHWQRADLG